MVMVKRNKVFIKLLLFALVIIFSCTGMAYARWTDGLQLTGKVEMGSIKPELVSVEVVPVPTFFNDELFIQLEQTVNIAINSENNSVQLSIIEARQGSEYKIFYTIHNDGTIPIALQISDYSYPGLLVKQDPIRIESQSTGIGEMTITVIDEEDMVFNFPLTFIQAVGI